MEDANSRLIVREIVLPSVFQGRQLPRRESSFEKFYDSLGWSSTSGVLNIYVGEERVYKATMMNMCETFVVQMCEQIMKSGQALMN